MGVRRSRLRHEFNPTDVIGPVSDLEAIEWIYKVPQAVLLLCNLVFLVWIMAVS